MTGYRQFTPIFVYRLTSGYYLCRSLGDEVDKPPEGSTLVASLDAKVWLQFYLNYDAKNRRRMIKELEGK